MRFLRVMFLFTLLVLINYIMLQLMIWAMITSQILIRRVFADPNFGAMNSPYHHFHSRNPNLPAKKNITFPNIYWAEEKNDRKTMPVTEFITKYDPEKKHLPTMKPKRVENLQGNPHQNHAVSFLIDYLMINGEQIDLEDLEANNDIYMLGIFPKFQHLNTEKLKWMNLSVVLKKPTNESYTTYI